MKIKLVGLMVSGLLAASSMAMAQGQTGEQPAAQAAEQLGLKEVTGRVIDVKEDHLILDINGVATPFYVHHETMLQGKRTKVDQPIHHQLKKDFKAGDNVTVSYELRKDRNHAMSINKR
ncbi:MAG: hypothetical protein AB2A00_35125 [Myxococcota bacterium]